MNAYHVHPIPRSMMAGFVAAHHYAVRVPPHHRGSVWQWPRKKQWPMGGV